MRSSERGEQRQGSRAAIDQEGLVEVGWHQRLVQGDLRCCTAQRPRQGGKNYRLD